MGEACLAVRAASVRPRGAPRGRGARRRSSCVRAAGTMVCGLASAGLNCCEPGGWPVPGGGLPYGWSMATVRTLVKPA
jgi:hypothetical protein